MEWGNQKQEAMKIRLIRYKVEVVNVSLSDLKISHPYPPGKAARRQQHVALYLHRVRTVTFCRISKRLRSRIAQRFTWFR